MDWAPKIVKPQLLFSLLESRRYQADIRDITSGLYRPAPRDSPPFSTILCFDFMSRSYIFLCSQNCQCYRPVVSGPVCCPFPHGISTESFSRGQSRKSASVTTETHSHKCSSPVLENVLTTYLCIEFVTQQCLFKTASWEMSGPG